MILDEGHFHVILSPVKEEPYSQSKESLVIELSEIKEHEPISHVKLNNYAQKEFLTPKIGQGEKLSFDYNQWRGIKGLLNESNVFELKESIHCGPEIRSTPVNIKL